MIENIKPWIEMREFTLCPWEPEFIRGDYTNPQASKLPSIYRMSRRQMKAYMNMMREFGYNGVQLIDSCYSWTFYGTPEAYHERLRMAAECAHEVGLHVTLWVWAACFSAHGWYDPEVASHKAPAEGKSAYDDPHMHAYFEKYYSIYAEMAPHTDMLIGHFFDPGILGNYDDIIAYMRLLVGKFKAHNENLEFGIDTWGAPEDYPDAVVKSGIELSLFLDQPIMFAWETERRRAFRRDIKAKGGNLGLWGWYNCEYETDQMAGMYVNCRVLSNIYGRLSSELGTNGQVCKYFSEMDACHLLNLFSMYSAAQLMLDPSRDPDALLHEAVSGIWSGEAAEAMRFVLRTIEDIRSGDSWESYWWTASDFRWGTGDDVADLARIERAIELILPLTEDRTLKSARFTLPYEPWVLARLILPHLEQMRLLAGFKLELASLESSSAALSKEELFASLSKHLVPIPDFNTWVGNFGQIERREQYRLAREFAKKHEIALPMHPLYLEALCRAALEKIAIIQKGHDFAVVVGGDFISEGYNAYSPEEAQAVFAKLEADGLVILHDGGYSLVGYERYRYHFDVN